MMCIILFNSVSWELLLIGDPCKSYKFSKGRVADNYLNDVLINDKVGSKAVTMLGLSLLAKGWSEYLGKRELCDDEIVVSLFICNRVC